MTEDFHHSTCFRLSSFGQLGPARQKGPTGSRAFVPSGPRKLRLGHGLPRLWFHSNARSANPTKRKKQQSVFVCTWQHVHHVSVRMFFLRHLQLQMQVGLHLRGLLGLSLRINNHLPLPSQLKPGELPLSNGAGFHSSSVFVKHGKIILILAWKPFLSTESWFDKRFIRKSHYTCSNTSQDTSSADSMLLKALLSAYKMSALLGNQAINFTSLKIHTSAAPSWPTAPTSKMLRRSAVRCLRFRTSDLTTFHYLTPSPGWPLLRKRFSSPTPPETSEIDTSMNPLLKNTNDLSYHQRLHQSYDVCICFRNPLGSTIDNPSVPLLSTGNNGFGTPAQ